MIDRVVCNFRYQGVKSIIDSVEIFPVSGESLCFTVEASPGASFLCKALYRRFDWDEIKPIYGKPWAESVRKAAEARKANAKLRRDSC